MAKWRKFYRVTIDLDTKKFFWIWLKLYFYRRQTKKIIVKRSTKKGYHIIIWLKHHVYKTEMFEIRVYFGDDKARLHLDKQRLKRNEPINILFDNHLDYFYTRY